MSNHKVRLAGIDRILKLMLDYILTIPGLIAIAPILAVIVLATKPDSPGLVIHRRRVMGLRGREFDAYNFRTMDTNGNEILAQYPEL